MPEPRPRPLTSPAVPCYTRGAAIDPPEVRTMEISARNVLKSMVKRVAPGAVNSEVVI